ncbi:MAG: SMC family ATPase, partial [Anaerolineae bacterium]|nr:SMC family ATPase [Anaerolineae bacterium]
MLPTRLEMRNFLAYRAPQPISFEGLDLACLSGDNGVGKSSILDAITWALWGRARAKRDEELIHHGQDDMQVQLDFEQDGARYRVIRRRARAGRGSRGALDLLAWGRQSSPRIINQGGIRRTQEQIKDLLRLDFETFVHSAYLQQGRADAFTLKTPAERKRVLSDILGLDSWTQYENESKQRLSKLSAQADILRHDISRIDEEIEREPQLKIELDELTQALQSAQAELDQASQHYEQVSNAADSLRRARENKAETERLIENRRADMELAQAEIKRQNDKIAEYQRTSEQGESIEAGYQQLVAARENQDQAMQHLARRQELDRQIHQLERTLADQRAAQVIRERIKGLQVMLNDASATDMAALQSQLQTLEALDAQRNTANRTRQKLVGQRAKVAANMDNLESEGKALNRRLKQLRQVEGPTCPLCGQALTAAHRDETLTQLE